MYKMFKNLDLDNDFFYRLRQGIRASTLKKEQCTDTRTSIGYISIYMRNCSLFLAVLDIYRYTTNAISCVCALFFFKCLGLMWTLAKGSCTNERTLRNNT